MPFYTWQRCHLYWKPSQLGNLWPECTNNVLPVGLLWGSSFDRLSTNPEDLSHCQHLETKGSSRAPFQLPAAHSSLLCWKWWACLKKLARDIFVFLAGGTATEASPMASFLDSSSLATTALSPFSYPKLPSLWCVLYSPPECIEAWILGQWGMPCQVRSCHVI